MYQRELHIRCARLISALLFICVCGMQAQDHDYVQYTTKDGLPTNYVYGVIEDDEGYIWAYTENGMAKFDGYTFKNFSAKDGLSGNDVVYALKDDAGKLWLQIYNGLPAYIFGDSVVTISDKIFFSMSLINGKINYTYPENNSIYYSNDQIIFYKTTLLDPFILKLEPQGFQLDSMVARQNGHGNWQEQPERSPFIHEAIDSVYYYSIQKGFIYKPTPHGYLLFSTLSGKFYWKKNGRKKVIDTNSGVASAESVLSTYIERLGNEEKYILSYNTGDLFLFNADKGEATNLSTKYRSIKYDLNKGNINILKSTFLVNGQKGFYELGFDGNLIDSINLSGLSENYTLLRHYKDSKGNLWIGSREGGLFLIPKSRRKTQRLTSPFSKDKAFEHFFKTKNGSLLAVTDNTGIYKIDALQTTQILKPNKKQRFRSGTNTPYGIILSSSQKSLIINEQGKYFSFQPFDQRFLVQKKDYYKYLKKINQTHLVDHPLNRIDMTYNEHSQTLFSSGSANYISRHLIYKNKTEARLTTFKATVLSYDSIRQDMYIGNPDGLFIFEKEQIIPFLETETTLKNISSLHADQQALWIGTENNGLYVYHFDSKKLSEKSNAQYIRNIRTTPANQLLVASNEGVFIFDKDQSSTTPVAHYTTNDGLSTNETQDAYTTDGRYIYVASSEGIHRIDQEAVYETEVHQNDLHITALQINKKDTPLNEQIELSHKENTLDIQFHLMSFASNGKTTYYTRLEPLEKEWRKSKTQNVNYLSLPSGKYNFQLKAEDIYRNSVQHPDLKIIINKAFWQTTWFKLLISLLILSLIIGIVRYRDQINRKKLDQEKEVNRRMAELELSALKAQMNPHFLFNALGAIQYFIQTNEVEAADNYLTRFARLMRKYLDSSKEKMISLKDEIELLTIYTDLEKLRFEDLFQIEIKVEKGLQVEDTYIPSMIVQPFVENAINHGLNERRDKRGLLQIHFSKKQESILCTIQDNGIGREKAQKNKWKGHKSRGMALIAEKTQTLKSSGLAEVIIDINDLDSGNQEFPGTQVILKIKNLDDEQL